MTWNYRVCKRTYRDEKYEETTYAIHEAYYNKNGEIYAITENGVSIIGEDVEDLGLAYERMGKAFEKDIIDMDNIVYAKDDFDEKDVAETKPI